MNHLGWLLCAGFMEGVIEQRALLQRWRAGNRGTVWESINNPIQAETGGIFQRCCSVLPGGRQDGSDVLLAAFVIIIKGALVEVGRGRRTATGLQEPTHAATKLVSPGFRGSNSCL